jgi:predicted DCC family thiol-disulfide oxidoreductase YuxK
MTGVATDPAGHGAGRVGYFTVLFDEGCPICRTARRWLAGRTQIVPLQFVPAGSAEARARFPGLDHAATLRDLTVIADDGAYYTGDGAWLACLWALADYRATAERLSSPHLLPAARRFIAAASAVRQSTRSPGPSRTWTADYGDQCDDRCH